MEWAGFPSHHGAVLVVYVAKQDGLCRASLLAGSLNFAIAHVSSLAFGFDLGGANALHAIGAFLHDTPAAHRHLRIMEKLETICYIIGILQEVEAPHFVRTVVRAIARADAAVIDHVI